jgi:hypothetical protein
MALVSLMVVSPSTVEGSEQQAAGNGPQSPDAACPQDGQCFADVPPANPFYAFINRIYQQDLVSGYPCGGPDEPCDSDNRPYYRPVNNVTRQQMAKFIDNARSLPSIEISATGATTPISVTNTTNTAILGVGGSVGVYGASENGVALFGISSGGEGVYGISSTGAGVHGSSFDNNGVYGASDGTAVAGVFGLGQSSSYGVHGLSTNTYAGVYGESSAASGGTGVIGVANGTNSVGVWGRSNGGLAGFFEGDVTVTGTCCAMAGGTTRIDDPLDPANKYLNQWLVQSPDLTTVINGNITTDGSGEATVDLPAWFETANGDFRYQLTTIGEFAQAIVSQKVKDGKFVIRTDKPNVEVSWQVTGVRQDPFAKAHPLQVEQVKPAGEQGKYLHPTEYGQPASAGVNYEAQQRMQQSQASKP